MIRFWESGADPRLCPRTAYGERLGDPSRVATTLPETFCGGSPEFASASAARDARLWWRLKRSRVAAR
ncbi:MAG TPA: hypothetical protein VFV38_52995 [Ktedonobacteraceae bacterium]|nr:hypothetical protein [Ktedonobacteraceae bacterium]